MREELRENDKIAETLNSLGSLRQKQRAFKDAEAFYLKSLELREMITVDPGAKDGSINSAKGKAQAVAQSLTSIGERAIPSDSLYSFSLYMTASGGKS